MPFSLGREKSLEELQEENERLDVELSIKQKKALIERLKQDGMTVNKDFCGSFKRAWNWFKTH